MLQQGRQGRRENTGRRETQGNVLVQADLQMEREVLKVPGIMSNCLGVAQAPQQVPFYLFSARPLKAGINGKMMEVNGEDLPRWLYTFFWILAWEGRRDGWAFYRVTDLWLPISSQKDRAQETLPNSKYPWKTTPEWAAGALCTSYLPWRQRPSETQQEIFPFWSRCGTKHHQRFSFQPLISGSQGRCSRGGVHLREPAGKTEFFLRRNV